MKNFAKYAAIAELATSIALTPSIANAANVTITGSVTPGSYKAGPVLPNGVLFQIFGDANNFVYCTSKNDLQSAPVTAASLSQGTIQVTIKAISTLGAADLPTPYDQSVWNGNNNERLHPEDCGLTASGQTNGVWFVTIANF